MSRSDPPPEREAGRWDQAVEGLVLGPGGGVFGSFLGRQRWFAAKGRPVGGARIVDGAWLEPGSAFVLLLAEVDGEPYYVPLARRPQGETPAVPPDREVQRQAGRVTYDAHWDPGFGPALLGAMARGLEVPASSGRFVFRAVPPPGPPAPAAAPALTSQPLRAEQSNTSMLVGARLIVKSYRRPQPGVNPDFEIPHFLTTRARFPHTPRLEGWLEYATGSGEPVILAVLQPFVENRGDGWTYALAHLRELVAALGPEPQAPGTDRLRALAGGFLEEMRRLGAITGALHAALAGDDSLPAFSPEPVTEADARRWQAQIRADIARTLARAEQQRPTLPAPVRARLDPLLAAREALERRVGDLDLLADGVTAKTRCHGDYHLGQVLKTPDGFAVIDFEGEPVRTMAERRAKHCPLRDVAGMLRSFNYAVHAALREPPGGTHPGLVAWLELWEALVRAAFLSGYREAAGRSPRPLWPRAAGAFERVTAAFELEKAVYELGYELGHRPDWIPIPAAGISRILGPEAHDHGR